MPHAQWMALILSILLTLHAQYALQKGSGKHRRSCKTKEERFKYNESSLKVIAIEGENKTCAYVKEVEDNYICLFTK
jgi:hypothetical protein